MDYGLYYEKARDQYTVHFANTKALKEEEIMNIFSDFGTVVSINTAGDIHGLRFIKYATLRETINCIKGLKNNALIKLLPERSKLNNKEDKDDSSGKKNNYNDRKKNKYIKGNFKNKQNISQSSQSLDEVLNDNVSINSKIQINKKVAHWYRQRVNVDFENGKSWDKDSAIEKISNLISKSCTTSEAGFQETFGTPSRSINSSINSKKSFQKCNRSNNIEIPGLISVGTSVCSGSTKSLDQISLTSHSVIEPKIVVAQHVIVANVHKDFGIHYILHLLEKYDPIAISLMQVVPQTFIRYCHVYFKKPHQTLEIEKKFDRFVLSGESLIVLRSHRLTEEA